MKRTIRLLLVSLCLIATAAQAEPGHKSAISVPLAPGQSAVVTADDQPTVTYRVTDADMARWARQVNKPRIVYRDRVVPGSTLVVHDTAYVASAHVWWPESRGFIPNWWPLLFMLGFLFLMAVLIASLWRNRDGRDGRDGLLGRDGRDAAAPYPSNPSGTGTGGIARPWLVVGDSMPAGTSLTVNRPTPPRK